MFSQPSKALHSMALEYGVRLLYHKSWAFADGQTQRHSRCTVTLPPEECQCGEAAGGCSSRPAFFREKIFDFLQYSTKCGDCPLFSLLSDALIRQGRWLTAKAADYAPHVLRVKSSRPPFAEEGPGRFFRICGGVR